MQPTAPEKKHVGCASIERWDMFLRRESLLRNILQGRSGKATVGKKHSDLQMVDELIYNSRS